MIADESRPLCKDRERLPSTGISHDLKPHPERFPMPDHQVALKVRLASSSGRVVLIEGRG